MPDPTDLTGRPPRVVEAVGGHPDAALDALARAVAGRLDLRDQARDADLASLRALPRFSALG